MRQLLIDIIAGIADLLLVFIGAAGIVAGMTLIQSLFN